MSSSPGNGDSIATVCRQGRREFCVVAGRETEAEGRGDYTDMPFMSGIDVGNDTRSVPPLGGKSSGIKKRNPTLQKSSLGSGKSSASGYGGGKSHQPLWPVVRGAECRRWDEGSDIWDEVSEIMTIREYPGVTGAHKSAASLPVVQTCETYLLPTVAALNLQVQQTCIPPVVAESLMANTRRSKLKPWKTKPIQVTPDPQLTLVRNPSLARERLDRPTRNRLKGHRPLLLPISLAHPRDPLASPWENWRD
ncbi:hypothetical protein SCLCIDRAFT_26956 [Scleroderma citrinum Foug A]|uniref:Uncharacterized protein n=1 Tax=Scleroderma citrinum Foug A TaxID=1036808 RepID=A0A0C3DVT5_9AGAM|nr:hypothetical protein SCLCIDRAFT_26956 [Scleroderma citrinum Foug A]